MQNIIYFYLFMKKFKPSFYEGWGNYHILSLSLFIFVHVFYLNVTNGWPEN